MKNTFTKPFEWILSDRYRIFFHLLFWLVVYLDEFLSIFGITPELENYGGLFLEIGADMLLVYVNLYILMPYFLFRHKFWTYIGLTFLALVINCFIMVSIYDDYPISDPNFLPNIIGVMLTTGTILGTAIGIKTFKYLIQKQQEIQELQSTNLKTELSFLKDQINPHFLFNSLNNIYVQSRKRPEEVPDSILLLSDLLRYQLYDCSKELVFLKDEIKYLKNYLELDKMRKTDTKVQFEIKGQPNGIMVAPFVFLPFVENAVKYSAIPEGDTFIDILIEILPKKINLTVKNTYGNNDNIHQGGIGLTNVKRRLELLYPDRHELKITDDKKIYSVFLRLDILDNITHV